MTATNPSGYHDAASTGIPPVTDFASDWDFSDPAWANDPYPIWQDLKQRCPMGHTDRFNEGMWLPLHFDDLTAIAHDTDTFSNVHHGIRRGGTTERGFFPPINSDPPEHHDIRRLILPFFAPKRIERWREHIRQDCISRVTAIVERGHGDAAVDYAQHIPVGAIASILDIDPDDGDQFRVWINQIVGAGADDAQVVGRAVGEVREYMARTMVQRRQNPGPDLISHLVAAELDGKPLPDETIELILVLQLVAGIDTTWSSIGAALWHFATHPHDRQRLNAEPELLRTAVEEMLRAYAPVNVTRRVTTDTNFRGIEMKEGDHIMMTFPIACRDETQFEDADQVLIDRARNRHVAFGSGIHRCLGSNLARLEMEVALETWLEFIPEYQLQAGTTVEWSTGQIRGPRSLPIEILQ